ALSQSPRVFNVSVSFDNTYDNAGGSLLTTACSNGPNGLATQFGNFSALPGFPNIGGAFVVDRFDSPMCGTCWALTVNRTTINVLAVDRTFNGQTFNIAEAAMDLLTNGFARFLGRVNATAVMV
ncbi:immunomodulatory protein, partial [Earliella scabrosa]